MTDNHFFKNKKVLFFQQRGWGKGIGRFLAKKLFDRGARLAALTSKYSTHLAIVSQNDVVYDFIESHDQIMNNPVQYLNGEDFSLKEICDDLGVDSIWPIISSSRMLVKSYGDKYYYGFKQNVSDEFLVKYIKAVYKSAKKIFSEFKPDIILAPNFASGHHILFYLYAKRRGVKMLTVSDSKIKGIFIFSLNFTDSEGYFYDFLDSLNSKSADTIARERAKNYIREFRDKFKKPDYASSGYSQKSLGSELRTLIGALKQIFLFYLKRPVNHMANIGPTIDWRPPHIIARDFLDERKNRKSAENRSYYLMEKLGKFAYFPLQYQPEAVIDSVSVHFSNQIETARQVAMSLPNDYTLVVKEHPGMLGMRPPSYLEKVARTPNVKLIDFRIPTEQVLKIADIIIAPGGTSLVEAAFYKKPAIQLGELGTTLQLPNVFKHTDFTTLSKKIKEVVSTNLDTPEYERRLENFVAAAFQTGFDLDYSGIWQGGKRDKMENLWQIYETEITRIIRANPPSK